MTYPSTYRQDPADMLAREFVTVYAAWGFGCIHEKGCPNVAGEATVPTSVGALRNGTATGAMCCADHEGRIFDLARRAGL